MSDHVLRIARFAAAEAIIKGADPIEAVVSEISEEGMHDKLLAEIARLERKIRAKCPTCSLSLPIRELDCSVRLLNCIERAGFGPDATIGNLCAWSADQWLRVRDFGRTTLRELETKLGHFGCALAVVAEPEKP